MTVRPSLLAPQAAPSEAVRRLARARNVLGGRDEQGRPRHPSMFDPDVISFAHGEGIRRPHPTVIAAGVRALLDTHESSLDNYLFLQRLRPLDDEITRGFMREGIDEHTARNICLDSGTTRLFCGFLHAVAAPGDVFLAAPAYYHPLGAWCELFRSRLERVPTRREHDYKLTRHDLEAWYAEHVTRRLTPPPKGLFLFNPTQTGGIYSRDELRDLAAFIDAHDLVVLEDAVFGQIEFDEAHVPAHLASFPELRERVVTVDGGSKAHALANIRIGWGCGPADLIERINAYTAATLATVPQIAKIMALAALRAPAAYLAGNRRECRERARLVIDLVAEADATLRHHLADSTEAPLLAVEHEPKAGHSILLSTPGLAGWRGPDGTIIRDSIDVTRALLTAAKVAVSPGLSSGFDGCEIRLCFGCVGLELTYRHSQAEEVMAALTEALRYAPPALATRELSAAMDALTRTYDPAPPDDNAGFAAGREEITRAFQERLIPALGELGRRNGPPRRSARPMRNGVVAASVPLASIQADNGNGNGSGNGSGPRHHRRDAGLSAAPRGPRPASTFPTLNQRGRTTAEPNEYGWSFINFAATCGAPALDIGAAFGVATLPALERGAEVIANDIEARHLQAIAKRVPAAQRPRLTLLWARFPAELSFPDNSLGAILASNVLNFLTGEEIESGAALMFRWLMPGGKVFTISGTPYAANISRVIPFYEARKGEGHRWPGEVSDIHRYACHETVAELPAFLHLLDDEVLGGVFTRAGFIIERAELYERANLPVYLRYDGRENVGVIARKP